MQACTTGTWCLTCSPPAPGIVLSADRPLGELCGQAEAPRPVDLAIESAAALKAAVIPIVLHYSTSDPLA